MIENRTDAQLYAAAILLTLECALSDLCPGRVSSAGTLWNRKITVWINDLQDMVIDFTAEDGIRVQVIETDKSGDSSGEASGGGDTRGMKQVFAIPDNADPDTLFEFARDVVIEAAEGICVDPAVLVRKISEVAHNAPRLQQAAISSTEAPKPPDVFGP